MKGNLGLWQLAGLTFTAVLGTLLHFLYGWTGDNKLVGAVSAVNESTWEHMKLFFAPSLAFALLQSLYFRDEYANFWCVKGVGIVVGVLSIPTLFYTLNGVFGETPDWVNVAIFFVCAGGVYWLEWYIFRGEMLGGKCLWALILLCVVGVLFVIFTYYPPHIPLFQDPITGRFGG